MTTLIHSFLCKTLKFHCALKCYLYTNLHYVDDFKLILCEYFYLEWIKRTGWRLWYTSSSEFYSKSVEFLNSLDKFENGIFFIRLYSTRGSSLYSRCLRQFSGFLCDDACEKIEKKIELLHHLHVIFKHSFVF